VFGAAGPLGREDPAPFDLPLQDEPLHDEPPPPYHSVVLQSTVVTVPGAAGAGRAAGAAAVAAGASCLLVHRHVTDPTARRACYRRRPVHRAGRRVRAAMG
jgi:hypothetical protein